MTKPDKLYEQLVRSSARTISFRDFERLVAAFGFDLRRTKGSHRQYSHPRIPFVMTVNPDGPSAHRYQVRLLLDYIEEYGLQLRV